MTVAIDLLPGKVTVAVAVGARGRVRATERERDDGVGTLLDGMALAAAEIGGRHSWVCRVDADFWKQLGVADCEHVDGGLG